MINIKPAPALAGVSAYSVPRHPGPLDLFLDGNEGVPTPPGLWASVEADSAERIRRYPGKASLEALLADRLGLPVEQLLVTAGADDAIDRVCRAVLAPGRELVLPVPTFEMIARYANMTGATVREVGWLSPAFPESALLSVIGKATALIAVVSPNNPTGVTVPRACIERILLAAPHALVLLDHAYVEFADEDNTTLVERHPNLVVVRTLSKAWGLAGLRVGYAVGAPEVISWMRSAGGPYAVSGPSLLLAEQRLRKESTDVRKFVSIIRKERTELAELCAACGVECWPSEGNFIFLAAPKSGFLWSALGGLGIAVRRFSGSKLSAESSADLAAEQVLLGGSLRITLPGDSTLFRRLKHALRSALAPEAILFDMDGVLVDVSQSYRLAIVETARSFGVTVHGQDIEALKAEGNANNDWVVTQRLMERKGKQHSLPEVTERFEAIYQGTADQPGLRRNEQLLVTAEWIARLAKRLPLGIVTGRPRADAVRLLEEHAIAGHFQAVVCMEDAALKPDPAPVRRALDLLGVQRAFLVGDTKDDIVAARAAGVIPLAVVSPAGMAGGDPAEVLKEREGAEQNLLCAGAALVLQRTAEVSEYL